VNIKEEVYRLNDALEEAKIQLQKQDILIQKLTSPPFTFATVIHVTKKKNYDTATINYNNKILEVYAPTDKKIEPGDNVNINMETLQIIGVSNNEVLKDVGTVITIKKVIDESYSEIEHESKSKIIFNGKFKNIKIGDRVILDPGSMIIINNLGKETSDFNCEESTNVCWKDIGGLENAKELMIETVELPYKNPKIFKFYKKKPVKGILLYGPPGCGKTMLGKATATALAKVHNKSEKTSGFFYIKGPEILNKYVGNSEETIRKIFQQTKDHFKENGYPGIIFIDEADSILGKRGTGVSSDMEKTIVPMFLTEMDGLTNSSSLVILATNRADTLDPAVLRDGRIDRKILIGRPNTENTKKIFKLNLKGIPIHKGSTISGLANFAGKELHCNNRILYKIHTKSNGVHDVTLRNIVNGGMIASIVEQAISIALKRDLLKRKPLGLSITELKNSIDEVERQNRNLNHEDSISEFIECFPHKNDISGIEKYKRVI